jgi:hypothetical protein
MALIPEATTQKAYDRLATREEIRQVSQQSYDEIAALLDEAHVIHDNATLLVVIEGVAYPISEIAEHH